MENTTSFGSIILFLACTLAFCAPKVPREDPAVWSKVKFDVDKLDKNGLYGPADGKVALNYEFCIPAQDAVWAAVQAIDSTASKMPGSRGRAGCKKDQWLVIGSTAQPGFRPVLYRLAALPYVAEIRQVDWE